MQPTVAMFTDYDRLVKSAKKDKKTLPCLDDILKEDGISGAGEIPMGTYSIPLELVVGTRTSARGSAFNSSFMPVMDQDSEFSGKWVALYASHLEEGIRDAVKAYEYKNRFYVEEGNKRVSVLKYSGADEIVAEVIRIPPARIVENQVYIEFGDFFRLSQSYHFVFSKPGSYEALQMAMGKRPDEPWTEDDRKDLKTLLTRYSTYYTEKAGIKESVDTYVDILDAFLSFVKLFNYKKALDMEITELKNLVISSMVEVDVEEKPELRMEPGDTSDKKTGLLGAIVGAPKQKPLKVAFINEKSAEESAWTYGHELGRMHIEEVFPGVVTTVKYDYANAENINQKLDDAIADGCNVIFTTSPPLLTASLQEAIEHRNVNILNCSLNTSHRAVRTYYARMYEAKFLMGAIAGAMTENDRIGYIADYPIFGAIANINAFAMGAKLVNPRAKVYLEWSTIKGVDLDKKFWEHHAGIISGQDFLIPINPVRRFGIYKYNENGDIRNLAMPVWNWGRFYEALIRQIWNGAFEKEDDDTDKGVNYWWGMSAEVIDVAVSRHLPIGTKRLVNLLKKTIKTGDFNPFEGVIYSQNGIITSYETDTLTPDEIVTMDWLAENIVGRIPDMSELVEQATPVVAQSGIKTTNALDEASSATGGDDESSGDS